MLRAVAWMYSLLVAASCLWAWVMEIPLYDSPREHTLPGLLLYLATLPTSLLAERLIEALPGDTGSAFGELALYTFSALLQVLAVWGLVAFLKSKFGLRSSA